MNKRSFAQWRVKHTIVKKKNKQLKREEKIFVILVCVCLLEFGACPHVSAHAGNKGSQHPHLCWMPAPPDARTSTTLLCFNSKEVGSTWAVAMEFWPGAFSSEASWGVFPACCLSSAVSNVHLSPSSWVKVTKGAQESMWLLWVLSLINQKILPWMDLTI